MDNPAPTPPPDDTCPPCDELSRANVTGMFVTLLLCQLTQPYGSLLYRGLGGFLWRVNPVASVVEACIVARHLLPALVCAVRDRRPVARALQRTASALLLLRGAQDDGGGRERLSELLRGELLDPPPGGGVSLGEEFGGPPAGWRPAHAAASAAAAAIPPGPHGPLQALTLHTRRSRLLHEAFGSNALAHHELRIDLLAGVSVGVVIAKLLSTTGAKPWLELGAWFMILGWFAVQALLVLFHHREMDEADMEASLRLASELLARIDGERASWVGVHLALHMPVFGYAAYLLTFPESVEFIFTDTGVTALVASVWWYVRGGAGWSVALFCTSFLIVISSQIITGTQSNANKTAWLFSLLVGYSLAGFLLYSVWIYVYVVPSRVYGEPLEPSLIPFSRLGYGIWNTAWLLVYTIGFTILYGICLVGSPATILRDSLMKLTRGRVALGNVLFALGVLIWALVAYDSRGTRKWWVLEYVS